MKVFPLLVCLALSALAQGEAPGQRSADPINAQTFAGLRARNIGPALVSGRVSQIAVFPDSSSHYLVVEASGGVWLTTNNGATWTPVFDNYGSYSIGTVTIDEKNPSVVWLGTGENNNQRSVSYGDGVTLPLKLREEARRVERELNQIDVALNGDRIWSATNEGVPEAMSGHVADAASPAQGTTGRPTKTAMEQYQIASDGLAAEIPKLRKLIETDIRNLEKQFDAAGAPPTPGRLPDWKGGK